MRGWSSAAVGFVGFAACSVDSAYVCSSDAQCSAGERVGRCEFDGYCSFDDDECPSGRRYGMWAPAGVADVCVDTGAGSTSTSESSEGQPSSATTSTSDDTSSTPATSADESTVAATLDPTGDSTGSSSVGDGSSSSSTGSGQVLDPDLIAWYRFDAIEGGTFADSSGNGHTASCDACPGIQDGVYGGALDADGEGQYLVVANAPAFATQTWTLAAWVWAGAPPTDFVTVAAKPVGVGLANSFELAMDPLSETTHVLAGWSDDIAFQSVGTTLPATQQWFHVAATLSDTRGTFYLDGKLVDEEALTVIPAFDDSDIYIGADVDNEVLENFYFGRVDDLRIYRRALTIDEVATIMAGDNL